MSFRVLFFFLFFQFNWLKAQPADPFNSKAFSVGPEIKLQAGNSFGINAGALFGYMVFFHGPEKTKVVGTNLGISTGYVLNRSQFNLTIKNTYQLKIPLAFGFQYEYRDNFKGESASIIEPLLGYSSFNFNNGGRLQYGLFLGYPFYIKGYGDSFPLNFHLSLAYNFPIH